jgi:hypothetical protein
MHPFSISQRIDQLALLGDILRTDTDERRTAIQSAASHNPWFSPANSLLALESISTHFLQKPILEQWAKKYPILETNPAPVRVGIVCAGNIPCVGFHDLLCGILAGAKLQLKLAEKDRILMLYILDALYQLDPVWREWVRVVPKLEHFDKIIATGSDSSGLFFEKYFGKFPNIIRQHRNSVAILDGTETETDLLSLGVDIFRYFGLGCRSVSKVYAPVGYDWKPFLEKMDNFQDIVQHTKYCNNFEYNRAIYLLNQTPHLVNNCMILLENPSLESRISCLHWESYQDETNLLEKLSQNSEKIQTIVSKNPIQGLKTVRFGQAQSPDIEDFADGIDTIDFILKNT